MNQDKTSKIIVVEDTQSRLENIITNLNNLGYMLQRNVFYTNNTVEAKKLIKSHQPDVVILDLHILANPDSKEPEFSNGKAVMDYIKKLNIEIVDKNIQVIIMSSNISEHRIIELLSDYNYFPSEDIEKLEILERELNQALTKPIEKEIEYSLKREYTSYLRRLDFLENKTYKNQFAKVLTKWSQKDYKECIAECYTFQQSILEKMTEEIKHVGANGEKVYNKDRLWKLYKDDVVDYVTNQYGVWLNTLRNISQKKYGSGEYKHDESKGDLVMRSHDGLMAIACVIPLLDRFLELELPKNG